MLDKDYYKARFFMTLKMARILKQRQKQDRRAILTATWIAFTDGWTGRKTNESR